MKQSLYGALLLTLLFSTQGFAVAVQTPQCITFPDGRIVAAWVVTPTLGHTVIKAVQGRAGTDPTTWSSTILSDGLCASENSHPLLASNSKGDVVITWHYPEPTTSHFVIAAAILPAGSVKWNIQKISDPTESAGSSDEVISIDDAGHLACIWSIYDPVANTSRIRLSTSQVGSASCWSTPITLEGA